MNKTFLLEGLVYLAAAVVFVPLAMRARMGSVLGYLIAGCVIGPWGLRLVQDPEQILGFAEIGVVLMLFLIGLEPRSSAAVAYAGYRYSAVARCR